MKPQGESPVRGEFRQLRDLLVRQAQPGEESVQVAAEGDHLVGDVALREHGRGKIRIVRRDIGREVRRELVAEVVGIIHGLRGIRRISVDEDVQDRDAVLHLAAMAGHFLLQRHAVRGREIDGLRDHDHRRLTLGLERRQGAAQRRALELRIIVPNGNDVARAAAVGKKEQHVEVERVVVVHADDELPLLSAGIGVDGKRLAALGRLVAAGCRNRVFRSAHASEVLDEFRHGSDLPRLSCQVLRPVQRLLGVADKRGNSGLNLHDGGSKGALFFDVDARGFVFAHLT